MFILKDILSPLQEQFSNTKQGRKRKVWFAYTLLAVVIPFTSSITSNLLRALQTLVGLDIKSQRFYAFMASPTLPWRSLWKSMWGQISTPNTDERILVAVDDSINPKSGQKIFACGNFHDHATKCNQGSYPWSQCIVAIGLLKKVQSRWACLPLDFRFYIMKKDILSESVNVKYKGEAVSFASKMEQAAEMVKEVQTYYQKSVLVVTDSWFGNNGLWAPLEQGDGGRFHLLSRMRTNITLWDFAPAATGNKGRGRPRIYGDRLGSVDDCAGKWHAMAKSYTVFLYGQKREVQAYSRLVMSKNLKCPVRVVWVYKKTRYVALMTTDLTLSIEQILEYYAARWKIESGFKEIKQEIGSSKSQTRNADAVLNHLNFCMMATTLTWVYADRLQKAPDRKYKIRGRAGFAFSDVRRIIAEEALKQDFQSICPLPRQKVQKSFVKTLLRMAA